MLCPLSGRRAGTVDPQRSSAFGRGGEYMKTALITLLAAMTRERLGGLERCCMMALSVV